MFIHLSDVFTSEDGRLDVKAELEMTEFDSGKERFAIVESSPVALYVTYVETGKALLQSDMRIILQAVCDRCLTEVPVVLELQDERVIFSPERLAEDEADDQRFLDGYELDVDAFVHDMIIGNWPAKILCREDCKGICPVCGQNLNVRECGCDSFVPDPRMAVIQDIFNANKEV